MTQGAKKIWFVAIFHLLLQPTPAQVSFCAVGDVLLDRGARKTAEKHGLEYPFENVRKVISKHNLSLFNLECPIADSLDGFPINKRYSFRAGPEYIQGLKYAGFNIANVANNHTMDYGKTGFMKTMELLEKDSIFCIGGGANQKQAFEPLLIEKNGETFAFFGILGFLLEGTTFCNDKPYPAFGQMDTLCKSIMRYNPVIDHIIVAFHWGVENSPLPTSQQVEYAHRAIDAGADLILGHHPHVLQSIETYRDKLIVYSLGNFVFDNPQEPQKQSAIFSCTFQDGKIMNPQLMPVHIQNCQPSLALPKTGNQIFGHLQKVSKPFNTSMEMKDNTIQIQYSPEKPVKELHCGNILFRLYKDRIKVYHQEIAGFDHHMPDTAYIFLDACLYTEDKVVYIYSIISNPATQKSRIAIFPFSMERDEFLQPSLDSHQGFNPWKLDLLDVDGDNNPELIAGVYKPTRYFENPENRVFVFNREKDYIYPKWLGSKMGNPILDFKVDRDSKQLVILEESKETNAKIAVSYKWNGFGFDNEEVLFKIEDLRNPKIQFLLSGFNFKTVKD